MKKTLLLSLLLGSFCVSAQELEKSPKRITFETGYSYIRKTNIPDLSKAGFVFAFDYMWQVSGFKNKPKAFISIPLGYISVPPIKENTKNLGIGYYGVHVTHELRRDQKIIPFIGYSLLFNQLHKQDTEGRVIGHETRFDAGTYIGSRFFLKAEYSIGSFPALGKKESDKLGTMGFKLGFRIK